MHKRLWNAMRLRLALKARGPLLVKSGLVSPNPSLPDMQFVRTWNGEGETLYIPGSSLKGVFRSFSEKVLRSADGEVACDPFDRDSFCGRKFEGSRGEETVRETWADYTARVYRESCKACKLFGHTRLRGRISFGDFLPEEDVKTEIRYGVAISRLSNAVAQGPFEMEAVVSGTFRGVVALENFEVWQVGLLALTVRAMNEGLVRVGFGRSRGFGEVEAKVEEVVVEVVGRSREKGRLYGVGALAPASERERYALAPGDLLDGLPEPEREEDLGFLVRRFYGAEGWGVLEGRAVEAFARALGVEV